MSKKRGGLVAVTAVTTLSHQKSRHMTQAEYIILPTSTLDKTAELKQT